VENIDSDNRCYFTVTIIREFAKAVEIKWEYHTGCHPPSSGKGERMNHTLKRQVAKLMLETKLSWTKCLPITLLYIRTAARKDIRLSLHEKLYGLPYLGKPTDLSTMETKDHFLKNYIPCISSTLFSLRLGSFSSDSSGVPN
jgi:hypothetical protein